jgi:hypothetical protein
MINVGKTVESYRMALESEINRWNGFDRALRKPDREAFEELMDMCRSYASESSNATNPIVFEPMTMSMVLFHQKRINELEKKLSAIHKQAIGSEQENQNQLNTQSTYLNK